MIDLHMHSTASDGTDTPQELVQKVREAGISCFSVTDHDTLDAWPELAGRLAEDPELKFVCGVEFTCADEEGKYHILGYGFDPEGASVREAVEKAHTNRMNKVHFRLGWMQENLGLHFSEEEITDLLSNPNPGKPHFGRLLVKKGLAPDITTAINTYVNRCPSRPFYLRPEEAIDAVLGSGGVPVLAHGFFGNGSQNLSEEELAGRVDRLTGMGLQGVEAFYSRYTPEQQRFLLELAERKDLYASAGSDYHGRNKSVRLGQTGLAGEPAMPLLRLLERLELR